MIANKRRALTRIAGAVAAGTLFAAGVPIGSSTAVAATTCMNDAGKYGMKVCATGNYSGKLVATGAVNQTLTARPGQSNSVKTLTPVTGVAVVTFYAAFAGSDYTKLIGSASWEPAKGGFCVALGGTATSPTSLSC